MKELIEKYLKNGLADFEGLEITGHIPVKQELLNALIADALKPKPISEDVASPASSDMPSFTPPPSEPVAVTPPAPKKSSSIDRKALTELVKGMVRRAEIKAVEGAIVLEFELRR